MTRKKKPKPPTPMLPAKPMLDWLEAHPVFYGAGTSQGLRLHTPGAPRPCYYEWIRREQVTVYQADEICIEWLKIHPDVIYGEDFWIGIEDEAV